MPKAFRLALTLLLGSAPLWSTAMRADAEPSPDIDLTGVPLTQIEARLAAGSLTSRQTVQFYLDRIAKIDRAGPKLQAVITLNPHALDDADARDQERAAGHARGPLQGVPLLIKDNIETADGMPTTAGSLALAENDGKRDAPVIARLRAAGAIILGKTNLSEWANYRSLRPVSGWSGMGGLTRNPYGTDRSASGSSSGSGAAVAASLAAAALGSETDGSVTSPANVCGIVGLKPTLGLVSRTHIVPISHSQDTAGPMGRTVSDVAALLSIMAGSDPADPATGEADAHRQDFAAMLKPDALHGKRLGVLRFLAGFHPETDAVFNHALETLKAQGATLVEITDFPAMKSVTDAESVVLSTEFKADVNTYLAGTPSAVTARNLADLIAFNTAHQPRELGMFGQELFEKSEATGGLSDPGYLAALATAKRLAGPEGLDKIMADNHLDAMVAPTGAPAWVVDAAMGDNAVGSAPTLPAVAGYPHLSVPMGTVFGLPVGMSFIAGQWQDAKVLAYGYAFEQARGPFPAPRYPNHLLTLPATADLNLPFRR